MQGAQVWFLVVQLRSPVPWGAAKNKKNIYFTSLMSNSIIWRSWRSDPAVCISADSCLWWRVALSVFLSLKYLDLSHGNSVQPELRGHPSKENYFCFCQVSSCSTNLRHFYANYSFASFQDYKGSINFNYPLAWGPI